MKFFLRLEHAAVAGFLLVLYGRSGESWWLFAALILVPDLSFAGYLAGPKSGAIVYNAAHSWIGVVLLAALGWVAGWPLALSVALIWAAHIAIDRALGYGLKHQTGFHDTHLGRIGKSGSR